jgi:hypothetical protein
MGAWQQLTGQTMLSKSKGDARMRTRHEGAGVVAPVPGAHQRHVVREHAADVGAGARGGDTRRVLQRLRDIHHTGFGREMDAASGSVHLDRHIEEISRFVMLQCYRVGTMQPHVVSTMHLELYSIPPPTVLAVATYGGCGATESKFILAPQHSHNPLSLQRLAQSTDNTMYLGAGLQQQARLRVERSRLMRRQPEVGCIVQLRTLRKSGCALSCQMQSTVLRPAGYTGLGDAS